MPDSNFKIFDFAPTVDDFRTALVAGMSKPQKEVPSKFIYDKRGSEIFGHIIDLPEYYIPGAEQKILADHATEFATLLDSHCYLLGYGSAASVKVRLLLDALPDPAVYAPLDISREVLIDGGRAIAKDYPALRVCAICADYMQTVNLPVPVGIEIGRRVGFFPGSTIGNVSIEDILHFLKNAAALLGAGGALIVGVDLKKDVNVIRTAYNDSQGVSASFQQNLLFRANRELGCDFDIEGFRHRAEYDAVKGRVEIGLVSLREQTVTLQDHEFLFKTGEFVRTQFAYKFTIEEFHALALRAGYMVEETWTDVDDLFSCHLLGII